jgi:dTDP-4-dehydrorhamnose reductase
MARLLITGAGGMLGVSLVLEARATGHQAIAVDCGHPVFHQGVETVVADLAAPGAAQAVLAAARPDWVIHCAAATSVDGCEADPALALRLNRDMAGQVALAARAVGARLAHISTDAVFDGERGGYAEEDEPHPVNVYGKSKREGELAVLAEDVRALVVRTNIYGWNAQAKQSLAEWFLCRLEAGERCPGFADVWFTPILVNDLAPLLLKMLEVGLRGIYHVGGGECLSKYEFGVRLAEVFGLDASLIQPVEVGATGLQAKRPSRLCLDGSKIERALRVRLPAAADGLERFAALRREGYVRRVKALMA